jgi:hypothetical protein
MGIMALLEARVDLNGNVLHPALVVCDYACQPFPHWHSTVHGQEHDFCAWCFHWIATNGMILPREMATCGCEQDCHNLARESTEAR